MKNKSLEQAINDAQPEYTKEQKEDIKQIEIDESKLKVYMQDTVIPGLFQQDIRFDVVEMYAVKMLEALISIQKGKTKNWEEFLKAKRENDNKMYSKRLNELEYVE